MKEATGTAGIENEGSLYLKILNHLGLWDVKSRPLVPPAPPKQLVWES
jgi:hypothetical protein